TCTKVDEQRGGLDVRDNSANGSLLCSHRSSRTSFGAEPSTHLEVMAQVYHKRLSDSKLMSYSKNYQSERLKTQSSHDDAVLVATGRKVLNHDESPEVDKPRNPVRRINSAVRRWSLAFGFNSITSDKSERLAPKTDVTQTSTKDENDSDSTEVMLGSASASTSDKGKQEPRRVNRLISKLKKRALAGKLFSSKVSHLIIIPHDSGSVYRVDQLQFIRLDLRHKPRVYHLSILLHRILVVVAGVSLI
ncbi:hypothetical protein Ciccas_012030, partial [Cichlidogyrus casuarinus]